MAKVTYDANMGLNHNFEISGNYAEGEMLIGAHTKTKAVFTNDFNQFDVVFEGEGFKYDGDAVNSGIVHKITFLDDDGIKLATISDFSHKISQLIDAMLDEGSVSDMLAKVMNHADKLIGSSAGEYMIGEAGNDIINGKGGADDIDGNTGKDVMTGGGGNDFFDFMGGSGQDVITDFDLGHEGSFDTLYIRNVGFEMHKAGKDDMRLDFEDGSSVLLEGVKFRDRGEINVDAVL